MLGPIFPQIFFQKFGTLPFISTPFGFVTSEQVYLDLGDLDLLNDLGHLLDFYRQLEFEGKSLSIFVPGHRGREQFCKCLRNLILNASQGVTFRPHQRKIYCADCDKLICELCLNKHKNHRIAEFCMPKTRQCVCCGYPNNLPLITYRNDRMTCLKCVEPHDPLVQTDPIIWFNIAEWIPIRGFLENRNVNSELYCRKMRYNFTEHGCKLNLIHKNVDYRLTNESTLKADAIWRIGEKYDVPDVLIEKLFKYGEPLKYTLVDVDKNLPVTMIVEN